MSLSAVFSKAQNIFSNASERFFTIVKNIENSGNKNYVRQDIITVNTNDMTVAVKQRSENQNMFEKLLDAKSSAVGQQRLLESFESLKDIMGTENKYNNSPSHYMAKLRDSLSVYSNNPSTDIFGKQIISDANALVYNLNTSSKEIQKIRAGADKEIDIEVSKLRGFLSELTVVNDQIKFKTVAKHDTHELLDKRDALLQNISEAIGISTIIRNNNDIIIYTSDGTTLFETVPRNINFEKMDLYSATSESKSVVIDGVKVAIPDQTHTAPKGRIKALLHIRDNVIPMFQNQLDEISRSLIRGFSEKDPFAGRSQDVLGLFIADGLKDPGNKLYKGMSEIIRVNPQYQSNPFFLRDGGSVSKNHLWNVKGFAEYSGLINHYCDSFNAMFSFDSAAGIGTNVSLLEYGKNSIGWLEKNRSTSHDSRMKNQVVFDHISESYSNTTGVNLQDELSFLIKVEQSYNISNKLMMSINRMLNTLLEGIK